MNKYKLILDESGTFSNNGEKYIIIGGLFYNIKYEQELDKKFRALHKNVCEAFKVKELHAADNKKYFTYICASIGAEKNIKPVIIVIDKEKSYIFKKYDKLSFKYNKAIEYLLLHMLSDDYFNEYDKVQIRIDNINISNREKSNLHNYLHERYRFVSKLEDSDSRKYICLQLADVIVNKFSKKMVISAKDKELVMLHPHIYTFLDETLEEYVKDVS